MAGVNNNLFPPIVDTFTPAFVLGQKSVCRVYFQLSLYNSYADIKGVQVIVQNQKTNASVLKKDLYPTGILFTQLQEDVTRTGADRYYITISNNDIEGDGFTLKTYYKVQIRFSTVTTSSPTDTWLSENLINFSQWSAVTLIKGISNPTVSLKNFDEQDADYIRFTYIDPKIMGAVQFDKEDDETLKSYRIKLYDANMNVLSDSGQLYTNPYSNTNEISYNFLYEFEDNTQYKIGLQITTKNLYSFPNEKIYSFSKDGVTYTSINNITLVAQSDDMGGRIKVSATGDNETEEKKNSNILFKRASSRNNFAIWEDIYRTKADIDKDLSLSFYDYTVEPGIWYIYAIMTENSVGLHSNAIAMNENQAVMLNCEDIFLNTGDNQLKIRFDPQISSFAYNISESRTETIGSQYPFFRRNGNIKYRSFPLAGTITSFMDVRENLMGASKEDVYRKAKDKYAAFNEQNHITPYDDYIYERQFRQKVMDFLYANNVKLFRSMTEGNILVKLMDISFTPNATLSRRIYSFSCTAYEIDACTIDNMKKYGVLKISDIDKTNFYQIQMKGMLINPSQDIWGVTTVQPQNQTMSLHSGLLRADPPEIKEEPIETTYDVNSKGFIDVISILSDKYQKLAVDGYITSVSALDGLKLELTSRPYLIRMGKDGEAKVVRLKDWKENEEDEFEDGKNGYVVGHLIEVNGEPVIIGKDGIYEINSNVKVSSLKLWQDDMNFALAYDVTVKNEENIAEIPKSYSSFNRIGQLVGTYDAEESIYKLIKDRYNQAYISSANESRYEQELEKLFKIGIYADPGTVVYVRQAQDDEAYPHIINETGYLEFFGPDTDIQELYFNKANEDDTRIKFTAMIDYRCSILRKRY